MTASSVQTASTRTAATDQPSAAAWAFVLSHSRVILSAARRTWSDARLDVDDFHHDLVVDIARNHHKFDAERSSACTWVYLRARYVKDHALRAMSARKDRQHSTRSIDVLASDDCPALSISAEPGDYGTPEAMIAQVTVAEVMAFASPSQAAACVSAMESWTGEEVRQNFGCSMSARNDRLHRLGRRVEKMADAP